jgi:pseudouridine-5'-phosphate glycosidase
MPYLEIHSEVAEALAAGTPVVALESTIIAHGLPRPDNLRVAREIERTVRDLGVVPATVAVCDGRVRIGLRDAELEQVAGRDDVAKLSLRDVGPAVAGSGWGATTVAATAHLAAHAGVRVFATGGLGGVHRGARESWDVSADLTTLATTAITVVCAGVKSILDVPATLEQLETLNVPVLGYRTDTFPGFYLSDSGHPLTERVDTVDAIATVLRVRAELGLDRGAVVVANPIPPAEQLDPRLHDTVLDAALSAAARARVTGKAVTPFLLEYFHRETAGASLAANIRLVRHNAALAARIAAAVADPGR